MKKRLPQYKIEDFYNLLKSRKTEIDEQLYDMLVSFTDFQIFKEMMLDYKIRRKGGNSFGLSIEKANFKNESFEDNLNNQKK